MKQLRKYPFFLLLILSVFLVSAYGFIGKLGKLTQVSAIDTPFLAASPSASISKKDIENLKAGKYSDFIQTVAVANGVHQLKELTLLLNQASEMSSVKHLEIPTMIVNDTDGTEIGSKDDQNKMIIKDANVEIKQVSKNEIGEDGDTVKQEEKDKTELAFQTVTDEYFDNALFIGDSRTEGFGLYSGLENITVYAKNGFQVYTAFNKGIVQTTVGKLTVPEALLNEPDRFQKIYLMFGLNEMGWGNEETFAEAYYNLIDAVKATQPNAVIYIQGVMHVSKTKSEQDRLFNNQNINLRNEQLKVIAENEHVYYLDLNEVFTDEEGNMFAEYTSDGIHLNAPYIEIWKTYLKKHAIVKN
ncbi:MAG: GDSL-type esterase/lipase family protein [Lachnospiraceae bacterium]|nr:GDSL-type esterase/lipase family protein [Lachnospiraceae bacterium]